MVHLTVYFICCAVLNCIFHFQGAFTWNIHFCVTWLFIREAAQMRRGFQEVEGRRINPTSPFAYLPHAVILPAPSLKKTKNCLQYANTHSRVCCTRFQLWWCCFSVLNLADDTWRGSCEIDKHFYCNEQRERGWIFKPVSPGSHSSKENH